MRVIGLKSATRGYGTMDYDLKDYEPADLVRMDVLVNGTLVAHGEVVVVNEKFGIRLTDVISPADRVKKLK